MDRLLLGVDAVVVRVPDLDMGLAFYERALGHELLWRADRAAGLHLGPGETELVLALDLGPETDLLVASLDDALDAVARAGGSVIAVPEDIPVGRVAVVRDPFGNALTLIELSKGRYETDESGRVTGVRGSVRQVENSPSNPS